MEGPEIRERTVTRRLFTISATRFENLIKTKFESSSETEPDEITLRCEVKKLEDLHARLIDLDSKVRGLILKEESEDDVLEKEMLHAEEYNNRWIMLQTQFDMLREKIRNNPVQKSTEKVRRFKLPDIKFKKFDGNLKSWIGFWSQFSEIHEDPSIDYDDKFLYLLGSIAENCEVYSLVESYPPTGKSYYTCVEELKQRYAREELLIEVYVRELLALVLQDKRDIVDLYDKLNAHLRALATLGVSNYGAFILPLVESALPVETLRLWDRNKASLLNDKENGPEEVLAKLMTFLKREVESLQRIEMACNLKQNEKQVNPTASCLLTNQDRKKANITSCIWCDKEGHSSMECYKIHNLTLEQRREILRKKRVCGICLRGGHHPRACKAFVKCLICQRRHSTLLCPSKQNEEKKPYLKEEQKVNNTTTNLSSHSTQTLLQTVIVNVRNGNEVLSARVLFDNGSQRSYIREELAKKLKLHPMCQEQLGHRLFGDVATKSKLHNVYNVNLKSSDSNFEVNIEALSQNKICGYIPKVNLNENNLCSILKKHNIDLNDTSNCKLNEIDILIGADYAGSLLTSCIVVLENGLVAIKTKLGWTLQGKQTDNSCNNIVTSLFCMSENNHNIADFWALETLGIKDPAEMKNRAEGEAEAVCKFEKTVKSLPDGRYEVELPFKVGFDDLLPNYEKARNRLDFNTKKLKRNGKYHEYDAIFKEWLKLGIIKRVPSDDTHNSREFGHYLPHKAVFKESSLTSATRPVFDASCSDKNGLCLNACLEKGVNYIDYIPKLLIGFRKGAIGVTSDIAKAFLQISLQPINRDYLKFLWWQDESLTHVVEYRHCRVVFGLTSSPFLLSATLKYHLDQVTGTHKETAKLLEKSFYVDNCLISLDTEEETHKFIEQSKEIMMAAKFDLRMWTTAPLKLNETGRDTVSVLGLNWNTVDDELSCNITTLPPSSALCKLTKRVVLSLAQKIFDPIGFTCPVTLSPRLLLQEMWRRELTWDESLPQDLAEEFCKWYNNLHYLKHCKISRRLTADKIKDCKLSLHMFCDASKNAIAACIFLKSEKDNKTTLQLVAAKSRVAPPKKVSIPRLELLAALVGVRLLVDTRNSLQLSNCKEYYWTDSSVTLYWICNNLTWNVFVGNRVKEIRENTNTNNWRHISGAHNWADLASRGCDAKQLVESRWTDGPEFLRHSEPEWPRSPLTTGETEAKKDLKKTSACNVNSNNNNNDDNNFSCKFLYFSKYSKIVRVVAWVLRFADKCLKKKVSISRYITSEEYGKAEKKLLLLLQQEHKEELEEKTKTTLTFHDEDKLVRIKTKLSLSSMPHDTKFPILVPAKHEITRRMLEQIHQQLQHAGMNFLMSDVRKTYWIYGLRRLARSVINNCIICKRYRVKQMQAPVAPLPVDRVESSAPFETTGVDLAGSLYLKNNEKCWIVLYTCAVYRAVHLELTTSLSTDAFSKTLRRFIARRGRVKNIYSDNGTNFIGAKNLLDSLDWVEIQNQTCAEKIKWKLNAPTGAWWGGFFERLIRTMKDLLRRVLGKANITYDELHTLLCECESIMNNRPLTYIQDDKADSLEPLTPACFLQPLPITDTTDLDLIDSLSLNNRLKYVQKLRDDFRHRFKTEYLTELIQRGKEKRKYKEMRDGQVVLIESDEKRLKWPLGIITKIYPGKDGVNRTAEIKTATGLKVRPIQRLYPLEISVETTQLPEVAHQSNKGKIKPNNNLDQPDQIGECTSTERKIVDTEKVTHCGRRVKIPSRYKL